MVPTSFPRPDLLVTVTGLLEILGAIGLMLSKVAPSAALGLTFMLLAVFPANVHAARRRLTIAGRPVDGPASSITPANRVLGGDNRSFCCW
jgi:uncharacterized membrane protein